MEKVLDFGAPLTGDFSFPEALACKGAFIAWGAVGLKPPHAGHPHAHTTLYTSVSTMKRILTLALASALALPALAHAEKGSPLWLRHQQISPDGSQIAFCYKGDIYTVPTAGGQALRLTSNAAYDGTPIWSPDSRSLAFSSDREGSKDV